MIGSVEDKADKIALNVQTDIKSVRDSIQQLSERTEQQYVLTGQGQMRLRNAILARNAEAIVKQHDLLAMEASDRLISGADYKSDQEWLIEYGYWRDALGIIDAAVGEWQKEHRPFLDVRARELNGCGICHQPI